MFDMTPHPASLTIYVVDDDEAVRHSLGMLLLSRGYTVQVFVSGESFLAANCQQQYGCAILDLRLGGLSGLQIFDQLRVQNSALVVLFLSGHGDIQLAVDAVKNGAMGWLEKPCSESLLLEKVESAFQQAAKNMQWEIDKLKAKLLWEKLTIREKEISRLVADGKSSKVIAKELSNIEYRTVETHRARAFAKLGLSNSIELDRFLRTNDF
jgi:two-component system, LuxR family, response regulator TtrR